MRQACRVETKSVKLVLIRTALILQNTYKLGLVNHGSHDIFGASYALVECSSVKLLPRLDDRRRRRILEGLRRCHGHKVPPGHS